MRVCQTSETAIFIAVLSENAFEKQDVDIVEIAFNEWQ